jgi:hypothetical protein
MFPYPINPSVLPKMPRAFENSFLFQIAGAQFSDVVGDATVERQDEPQGQFRDGNGVLPATVGHVDAMP